jgi:hypothetical protein
MKTWLLFLAGLVTGAGLMLLLLGRFSVVAAGGEVTAAFRLDRLTGHVSTVLFDGSQREADGK